MRRFAPAFSRRSSGCAGWAGSTTRGSTTSSGRNQLIIDQTAIVDRPRRHPRKLMARARDARPRAGRGRARRRCPPSSPAPTGCCCGLGSHDLSAMRELLGRPRGSRPRDSGAAAASSPRCWSTTTSSSLLRDRVSTSSVRFDAHLEVYGEKARSGSSTTRRTSVTSRRRSSSRRPSGDALTRTVSSDRTCKDPYTHELEYFHDVVTEGSPEDHARGLRRGPRPLRRDHPGSGPVALSEWLSRRSRRCWRGRCGGCLARVGKLLRRYRSPPRAGAGNCVVVGHG